MGSESLLSHKHNRSSVYFRLVLFAAFIVHLVMALYSLNLVSGISRPLQWGLWGLRRTNHLFNLPYNVQYPVSKVNTGTKKYA